MKAEDIMTRAVATIAENATLRDAVNTMLDKHVSGVPVVDSDGTLVGILTEGDLLRRAETNTAERRSRWLKLLLGPSRIAADYVHEHSRQVSDLMTRDVITAKADTPLAELVRLMQDGRIKRLPIAEERKPVGIVSRADLLRALGQILAEKESPLRSDAAIREHILAELRHQGWMRDEGITVDVVEGIATLQGVVYDQRIKDAVRVAAQNTPGVVEVHDEISSIDPTSIMPVGL